ncbi:hypothetical protein C8R44DRAFT_988453, partial [Mycena epipterygia]
HILITTNDPNQVVPSPIWCESRLFRHPVDTIIQERPAAAPPRDVPPLPINNRNLSPSIIPPRRLIYNAQRQITAPTAPAPAKTSTFTPTRTCTRTHDEVHACYPAGARRRRLRGPRARPHPRGQHRRPDHGRGRRVHRPACRLLASPCHPLS